MLGSFYPEIVVIGNLLFIYSAFAFRNLYSVEKSGFSEVQKSEGASNSFKRCITNFLLRGQTDTKILIGCLSVLYVSRKK